MEVSFSGIGRGRCLCLDHIVGAWFFLKLTFHSYLCASRRKIRRLSFPSKSPRLHVRSGKNFIMRDSCILHISVRKCCQETDHSPSIPLIWIGLNNITPDRTPNKYLVVASHVHIQGSLPQGYKPRIGSRFWIICSKVPMATSKSSSNEILSCFSHLLAICSKSFWV